MKKLLFLTMTLMLTFSVAAFSKSETAGEVETDNKSTFCNDDKSHKIIEVAADKVEGSKGAEIKDESGPAVTP